LSNVQVKLPNQIFSFKKKQLFYQIFDEKLNWDAQAKVHCWSEIDLRQLTKKKSIFAVDKTASIFSPYIIFHLAISRSQME
jgi:hypothetical protein